AAPQASDHSATTASRTARTAIARRARALRSPSARRPACAPRGICVVDTAMVVLLGVGRRGRVERLVQLACGARRARAEAEQIKAFHADQPPIAAGGRG